MSENDWDTMPIDEVEKRIMRAQWTRTDRRTPDKDGVFRQSAHRGKDEPGVSVEGKDFDDVTRKLAKLLDERGLLDENWRPKPRTPRS